MNRLFFFFFIAIFSCCCNSLAGQAISKQQQEEILKGILKSLPPEASESQKEELKRKIQDDFNISQWEIEKEKARLFKKTGWSSEKDGFALEKICEEPQYAEAKILGGKVKRFEWSEVSEKTFFVFRITIAPEYHFTDKDRSYEQRLESLKDSVIVMGKMGGWKILTTEVTSWGNIAPVIVYISEGARSNHTCRKINSAFSHRNRLWQVGIEYPVQTQGDPLGKFEWFLSQIKLF